jgi:hypothetical protein
MRNRPGRIFYMIDFKGLDAQFIQEYCEDNLDNKTYIDQIVKLATLFTEFNFDMLKAMVEDMNRYDETPQQVMQLLNAKPEYDNRESSKFKVELTDEKGNIVDEKNLYTKTWNRNPLSCNTITIELQESRTTLDDEDGEYEYVFNQSDLYNVNGQTGTFEYRSKDGSKLKLTREKTHVFNYFGAL